LVEKDRFEGKRKIEIHNPDSYLASCAVKIQDYRKCVNAAFKEEGDLVYVVGTTKNHLGASQYNSAMGYKEQQMPFECGNVPKVDFNEFIADSKAIHNAIDNELVASCSYIHAGGLMTALAKAAMAGEKGVELDTRLVRQDGSCGLDEEVLYSETPGRFIMTVAPSDRERFEQSMAGATYNQIGTVRHDGMNVRNRLREEESIDLMKVKKSYQAPLSFGLNRLAESTVN
jgi:phosphoribosylformylglycinamidine synthase